MDNMQIEKECKEEGKQDYLREKEFFWEIYKENRKEEEEARLKSRILWLKAGDKNTSFFHNTMKIRRARNQIEKIQVESQEVKSAKELKKAAHKHFKNLLSTKEEMAEYEDFLQHTKKIKRDQNIEMCKELTEEEVVAAIWSLHLDKAPGPDGFTIEIYRFHWYTTRKDFLRMVKNVLKKIGSNTKSSYLALVPKESNPSTFNRFRPISLCNSSYKIITKIIANRIKEVLPIIISENQGGFVPNMQIIDNVIIVQEVVHSSMQRKEKGIIIKLDMANSFDRVIIPYLMAVLKKLGFPREIIEIIQACITAP